jgi:hypothetical protein
MTGSELRLRIGSRSTGVTVRTDSRYPTMWRVHSADGRMSDIVNLTRAKDAAIALARPRGLGRCEVAYWDSRETAPAASPMRYSDRAAA